MHTLDEHDKMLLRLVQQNNLMTAQELGDKVHLSASAVQRRLARLRGEKVIVADVSILSPSAGGMGLTCIVDVVLEYDNTETLDRLRNIFKQCPEVMQCYYVTGTYDLVLIVNTRDMEHYENFSKKYLMDDSSIKHFYTHAVMNRLKVEHSVFI